ncbi:YbaK/prolyl-tRNA synthetase associated region [Candidatus Filomicrobium marinum]|uniref:YbaK/prolyl-tRNA synthetase associated region n=1 Tax=Candidatus Filomicrobium marinum TaxID=1608628 RepID=A0A0D6JEJ4_9HYPH|nr:MULTISPECIES: YbaK/EbsC family protein [Filomicrobium]MCV0367985.1 YbaK/EbsC family protein [Filomicrobium sp.]CFX16801.1 YbaK/prolyl-tRNA synthetase associated region [Candidatus Filomicrobium marinum]CPR18149.1 YbaK/prolyl-tRNA synthetase associated region [Candidatus Filomicrobium marinum]
MAISLTLQQYLDDKHIKYDVLTHDRKMTSSQIAEASHVPGDRLAKAVILSREGGFVAAVIPASCKVRLDAVGELIDGPICLSTEDEIEVLFPDCDLGAIPAVAPAYGLDAIVDERLGQVDDVYFEGGDHCSLIHLSGEQFRQLLNQAPQASIAEHA